jgi:hypothetical protein
MSKVHKKTAGDGKIDTEETWMKQSDTRPANSIKKRRTIRASCRKSKSESDVPNTKPSMPKALKGQLPSPQKIAPLLDDL